MMKSWTSIPIILFFVFTAACSRNPLGEDLSQQILNLGFRLSQTCSTSLNQDTTLTCPIIPDEVIAGLTWTLEPGTTCTWATINAGTGVVSGTPNDNNVGTCDLMVGSRNAKRLALTLQVPITVVNVAPVFTAITTAANILEDSGLTVIRTGSDVQTSEEGFGNYSFANASTTAPRCFDNAITLSIDPTTGAISYQPAANYFGTCFIRASFDDGNLQANSVATSEFSITILPINDAPTIGSIANQSTFESTTLPVTLNINDVDNALLCSGANLSATSSNTTIVNASGISFSGIAPNCILTISPIPFMNGPTTIAVTVTDGTLSATTSFILNVIPVPDPPVVSPIANQSIAEDGSVTINFVITDPDSILNCSTSMSAVSSDITLLPVANIIFSGTAPNCSALLSPAANQNGVSNLVITVSDGVLTAASSFSLAVAAVNDAPLISAIGNQTTNEDTSVAVNFTVTDVDNTLNCSTSISATSSNGALLPVASIVFSGTAPNCVATLSSLADQNGVSNLAFTVSDGTLLTTRSFILTVAAVNDAPLISAIGNQTTNEDTSVAVNFTVTDVDNTLNCSTSISATSSNGALLPVASIVFSGTAPNCVATLSPFADQSGSSNLVLTVNDGALVGTSSFSLNVVPINDFPLISVIGNQVTNEDTATAALPFTITDVDSTLICNGTNISVTSSDLTLLPVSQIIIAGTAPNCTVTMNPAINRNGSANVVITVADNGIPNLQATSSFSLFVNAVNDAPVISAIPPQTTNEGIPLNVNFTINDVDNALVCSTDILATSSDGVLLPTGSIVFSGTAPNCVANLSPTINTNGSTNLVFTVTDGALTGTSAFTLTVTAYDDPPVISAISNQIVNEDNSILVNYTITDVDSPLSCNGSMSISSSNAGLLPVGNVIFLGTAPNCTLSLNPAANQNGLTNLILTVTDGTTPISTSLTLTVNPVNDLPVISALANQTISEDATTTAIPFTITDIDNTLNCSTSMSASSSNIALLPVANIVFAGTAPNCTVTMMPTANSNGGSTVAISVTDGIGTSTRTFNLTVTAVNDPPVISTIIDQTIAEDSSTAAIPFTITDIDSLLLCTSANLSATSSNTTLLPAANIVFGGAAPNCTVTMSPVPNGFGSSSVVITVADNGTPNLQATSAFNLVVTPTNDAPVISAVGNITIAEDNSIAGVAFVITDVDNTLTCATSVSATSSNGILIPTANILISGTAPNCLLSLTPLPDANGLANIVLTVTDGSLSATSLFSLTVNPVNDAPVISTIAAQTTGEGVVLNVPFTISDVDSTLACGADVTASSSNGVLLPVGSITFSGTAPSCTVTLNPTANTNGATNIVFTVTDGLLSATRAFTLTVTAYDDPPAISAIANQSINEDTSLAFGFTVNDIDSTLNCSTSVSATSSNTTLLPVGNIIFSGAAPNCTATLTPPSNQNGLTNLVFTLTDGTTAVTRSFSLTVIATNDLPIISGVANQTISEDTSTAAIPFTITDVDNTLSCSTSMSATSTDTTLLPLANIVFAGTAPNCTVTLTPVANASGISNVVVVVNDGTGTATSPFSLTVTAVNDIPMISTIANQTIAEDSSTAAIPFTMTDIDSLLLCTSANLSVTSSNTTLLPTANIFFGGAAPNCTVTMSPVPNGFGSSNVVVTVMDNGIPNLQATSGFSLTVNPVNDLPVISAIANQNINEDTSTGAISFLITDVDNTLVCSTSVSATSTDSVLLPIANIVIAGTAPNCTVTLSPVANGFGSSNVVLTVTDGSAMVASGLTLTVNPINDNPIISNIVAQSTIEGISIPVNFTITDIDNVVNCGTSVTATSSNTTLLPVSSITFSGTAPNCTATLNPTINTNGVSNISLIVSDGAATGANNFTFTVTAYNDPPVISAVSNQSTNEDTVTAAIFFTITDVDNALNCSTSMSATSSNTTVLPVASIVFAGTAPNCTVTMTPALNQSGVANIIFTVTDGATPVTTSFSLTVVAQNDAPVISAVSNQSTNEDTVTAAIPFTITDVDNALNCSTSMSATSSNTTLLPVASIVFAGTAPNCTVTMTPAADGFGTSNVILSVTDGTITSNSSYTLTVVAQNDAPVISAVANQSTNEDTVTAAVPFTITDVDSTLNCSTSMSATSSNTTLLPVASIVFAGTAPNCTVTMTPALNQSGVANIVLTVTDGFLSATSAFTLTVVAQNDPPVISAVTNQSTNEDTVTAAVPFTITDVDNALNCSTSMSATSSNTTVLPVGNIVFAGTAPNCTVTMTPALNQSGVANIIFTVTDGATPVTTSFSLTVVAQNDAPVISAVSNQSTNEDTVTAVIPFTITDVDNALNCSTSMSATSSNTTLLPVASIVFAGTAPNCTVTMAPALNQSGVANIVLTVTDGILSATSAFSLTVVAQNDAPVISVVANQSTNEDTATAAIPYTITDVDNTLNCSTSMSASSSNVTLLPVANIVFAGTAPNCTVTMTPIADGFGTSNVLLTVTDGSLAATSSFTLTVAAQNDAPVISAIANITTAEDTATSATAFTITDVDNTLNCSTSMTASSSNVSLIPNANIVFGGTAPNCTVVFTPLLNANGISNITLTVTDGIIPITSSFSVTVTAVNDAPVISVIANQTTAEDTATTAIPFTITDVDSTLNCSTSMNATSSNAALLPVASVVFGGIAPNCTVTMTPASNGFGLSSVVLTVTDGSTSVASAFNLTVTPVNDSPIISAVGNQTTNEETATSAIAFTITDVDNALNCSTSMSATSSNAALLPVASIVFGGTAPNCTVVMTPTLNQSGVSNIALSVTDGLLSASSPFSLTVNPVNDAPIISAIANQSTNEDIATAAIPFTITDVDSTLSCSTSMSASSSNIALLPVANIVFAGAAPNCTVTMTPVANGFGSSNVLLTVSDGSLAATSPFTLTVAAQNDAPLISSIGNQSANEDVATVPAPFTITDVDNVLSCTTSMSATSSNTAVLPVANIIFGGTAPNCTVTMTAGLNQNGTSSVVVTVTDSGALSASTSFVLTAVAVNDAPIISAVVNQTTSEGSDVVINFTITDIDSVLMCTSVNLAATSSNSTLIPIANVVYSGTVPNCVATITPAPSQNGLSNLVITVMDNETPNLQDTTAFSVTVTPVNDPPVLSFIADRSVAEDTVTIVNFTITDVDSVLNCTTSMSATSTNTALIPDANIVFSGTAPNCTATITPTANASGLSDLLFVVSDTIDTNNRAFTLTVTAINDPPVISAITNRTTNEDTAAAAIAFTISDVETAVSCTTSVTMTSSNTATVPVANVVFSGTAPNCSAIVTPAANANGITNLAFVVTDGTASVSSLFTLTVTAVNDPPVLSAIANQTINEDSTTGAIAFTITDVDNSLNCSTSATATSSDTTLLPVVNILFAGTAPNCTVTMSPVANGNGASTVVVSLTDGIATVTRSMVLTVTAQNDAPIISFIANQTIAEDTNTGAIPFTISDVETALNCTTSVSATSSNVTMLPVANIVFAGTAPNCTLTMSPVADGNGASTVVVSVTDGTVASTRSVTLTVTAVNDAPAMTLIANQTLKTDSSVILAYTLSDPDNTMNCSTSIAATSGTATVIANADLVKGGTAPNCTLTVTPSLNAAGSSLISVAATDGTSTTTNTFTVTTVRVNSLAVTPTPFSLIGVGSTQQIIATAAYSDSSTADISTAVGASWISSVPATATVNNAGFKGLVTAAAGSGNVNVTVTYKSLTAVAAITVYQITGITVSQSVFTGGIGSVQAVTAQAILNPSGTSDITSVATWATSNATVASVSGGVITLNAVGTATVTASYAGYSQTISITVQNKTLTSIAVTPASASVAVNGTQNFVATATYSDASTQVVTTSATWSTSNAGVASISNTAPTLGRATGVATGSVTVTATIGGVAGNATLTITGASLTSIAITPFDALVTSSGTFQFTATGTFSDATTSNITDQVTWSSSTTTTATISNVAGSRGLVTTPTFSGYRTTTLTATLGAVNGTSPLGVNGATISSILVTPTVTLTAGSTYNLKAYANLSDGGTVDVTDYAVWSSASTAAVTVSNGVGTKGLVTGVGAGTSSVSAVYSSVTGSRTVTVAGAAAVVEVGTGLTGDYYSFTGAAPPASPFIAGNKKGTRIDARVNFAWGMGSAPMGISDSFAVRWTGFFVPTSATTYFCAYSDDGMRVSVNGTQIINDWSNHAARYSCSTAQSLVVGTKYPITVEYYENGGESEAHVTSSPTSAAAAQSLGNVIPQSQLYPQ